MTDRATPTATDPLAVLARAVAASLTDLADLTRAQDAMETVGRRLQIALSRLPAHLAGSTPAVAVRTVCSYIAAGSAADTHAALLTAQDTMPVAWTGPAAPVAGDRGERPDPRPAH